MSKKTTDIVGYLTPIGFIIAFLAGTREESRFHLNQSLVIIVLELILEVLAKVAEFIPLLGILVGFAAGILSLVLAIIWIIALVSAIKGEEKPMPLLGGIKLI